MASRTKKSRKAGTQKSAKTTAKKGAKKAAKNGGGSDGIVTHPPVIITDGSASIEFEDDEYPQVSTTTHQSRHLKLTEISSNKKHTDGTTVCYELDDEETVVIVVTCEVGGTTDPKTMEIRGGNFDDGSVSPSIKFDHKVFNETFPPIKPGKRRRVGKKNRDITSLQIFSDNELVHDCDVVTTKKNFEITVNDDHVEDDQ